MATTESVAAKPSAKPLPIFKVGVVGGGAMGGGIAQVVSNSGLPVVIKDINQEAVDKGIQSARTVYERRVKKGKMSANEMEQKMALISGTLDYKDFADCDLVIEAVTEKMAVKKAVFAELDQHCQPSCILATNTSALSIKEIASATKRPDKVGGLHFFNPAPVMKLVEVIRAEQTSDQTIATLLAFCADARKSPVLVVDNAGFLVNRLLLASFNEAVKALEEGAASAEEIDMQVPSRGFPMGPFVLADMLGIDVCAEVVHTLHQAFGDRFTPAELLDWLVSEKRYGQKTGAGFYGYGEATDEPVKAKIAEIAGRYQGEKVPFEVERFIVPMINEAARMLEERSVAKEDVDPAMQMGTGMGRGPLTLADQMGLDVVVEKLKLYEQKLGSRFKPTPLLEKMVAEGKLGAKTGEGFFKHEAPVEGGKAARQFVQVKKDGAVAVVALNNPPVNALNSGVMAELADVADEIAADDTVKAVVLYGEGALAFVAGADIKEIAELKRGADAKGMIFKGQGVLDKIEKGTKPWIAAIHGFCLGGGNELAMACHMRIVSDKAKFGQPEINLGIIPGFGGTQRFPRMIGYAQATEWLLTGDMMTAQQAFRFGLVNKVVPDGDQLNQAIALAKKIATKGRLAIQYTMEALHGGFEKPLAEGLKAEAEAFAKVCDTEDKKVGVSAFITKQQPKFVDR